MIIEKICLKSGEIYPKECIYKIVKALSEKYSEKFSWCYPIRAGFIYYQPYTYLTSNTEYLTEEIDFFIDLFFNFKYGCQDLTLELYSVESLIECISNTIERINRRFFND